MFICTDVSAVERDEKWWGLSEREREISLKSLEKMLDFSGAGLQEASRIPLLNS